MFTTMRVVAVGFAVAAAAFLIGPLHAQTEQQEHWCQGEGGVPEDVQVSACTVLIQSGRYSGRDLAWAYYNRGVSQAQQSRCDLAIQDFTASIKLDPANADGYWVRHLCKRQLGDAAGAEADYRAAKRLNPNIEQQF
jgi:tetratricopeptide (TPR) repeat protein